MTSVFCKSAGCEGVVVGLLLPDGNIDVTRLNILVDIAYPMEVTFHRAFDRARDPMIALEKIIDSGCQRILTSGQKPGVDEGLALLSRLVEKANNLIMIMPGSGVRASNIRSLQEVTGATEFHSSARKLMVSQMDFLNHEMREELHSAEVDGEEVKRMSDFLRMKRTNGED